jgi:hypothetical protein
VSDICSIYVELEFLRHYLNLLEWSFMFMSGTNCTVSSITHSNDDSIVPLILVRECRNWLPVLDFGGSRYVSEHISTNIWAVPHSLFATPLVHAAIVSASLFFTSSAVVATNLS